MATKLKKIYLPHGGITQLAGILKLNRMTVSKALDGNFKQTSQSYERYKAIRKRARELYL